MSSVVELTNLRLCTGIPFRRELFLHRFWEDEYSDRTIVRPGHTLQIMLLSLKAFAVDAAKQGFKDICQDLRILCFRFISASCRGIEEAMNTFMEPLLHSLLFYKKNFLPISYMKQAIALKVS